VALIRPKGQAARDAVVDPAADDSVFPQELAKVIGLDIRIAPTGERDTEPVSKVLYRQQLRPLW
jgi:hypothetical protein